MKEDETISETISEVALDELAINTIRFLSVDAVQKADSGHPGLPLGAAPMAYVLWTKFLKHNPANPDWFDRDRFILSAGHGSMLLYSLLHLTGYDVPLEQIKQFRQWGSMTPGHPERGLAPGVEVSTGPLGQGFGNGLGMAIAEAYLAARFNKPGFEIINHYTYGLVSDGDLMEGVAAETASLAGHLKLGKLIYLYDNNHVTLSSSTQLVFTDDHARRFESYGWHTLTIEDGNDLEAISQAIQKAKDEKERPSLIIVNTHIGYGSPKQDTFRVHGAPLGEEDVKVTKKNLGWPLEPLFYIPQQVSQHFLKALSKGDREESMWSERWTAYERQYPQLAYELTLLMRGEVPKQWDAALPSFPPDHKGLATRNASAKILDAVHSRLPGLIGGSADLNPSTFTELKNAGTFEHPSMAVGDLQGSADGGYSYAGRNIMFGVREHAMGAILNGLAAHGGTIPFGATFLTFSDYMRPAIRLASLMELHVIYVFTHDSIGMGEDGPTHQPIEHIAALRAIPGLNVIRPCDANETVAAWKAAVDIWTHPTALILTRQNVPVFDRSQFASAENLMFGAYILADDPDPEIILIASGSEVQLIIGARDKLKQQNIRVRLVSMPSWELFEAQPSEYHEKVLPSSMPLRLAVEAALPMGWEKYTGAMGDIIGMDHFGASAPGPLLMREFGFTIDEVYTRSMILLKKRNNK